MSGITLLSEIIAQSNKVAASFYRDQAEFAELLRLGFLREAGIITSIVCMDCDQEHAAQIVCVTEGYGYYCPELGFFPLDRSEVSAVQPDLAVLVQRLADAGRCTRRKDSAIHGQTWRIGSVEADAGSVRLYFHPRLQSEEDARNLADAMSREVRCDWRLIVSASGSLPTEGAEVVRLDEVAEIDLKTGSLLFTAHPADLVRMPRKNIGGRPSDYSEALVEVILQRSLSGQKRLGVNEECRAILSDFKTYHPKRKAPSFSTIKRHLKRTQGGA